MIWRQQASERTHAHARANITSRTRTDLASRQNWQPHTRDSWTVLHHTAANSMQGPNIFLTDESQGLKCLQGTTRSAALCVLAKCWYPTTRLHVVTTQKTTGIFRAVEISNLCYTYGNIGFRSPPRVCCLFIVKRRYSDTSANEWRC